MSRERSEPRFFRAAGGDFWDLRPLSMNFETICLQSHAIPLPVNAIFELSTFCERTSCVITAPASAQLQRCAVQVPSRTRAAGTSRLKLCSELKLRIQATLEFQVNSTHLRRHTMAIARSLSTAVL